jgi:uncharacterized protein
MDLSGQPTAPSIDLEGMKQYFVRQPDIVVAYLFGSVARGRAHKLSDVDVAILFAPEVGLEESVERQLQLMGDLEQFADREVQVTVLNRATPLLTYQVVKYGVLLFERNHNERMIFEVNTIKVYFDLQPMYRLFDRLLAKQIREEGLGQRRRHADLLEAARRIQERLERVAEN